MGAWLSSPFNASNAQIANLRTHSSISTHVTTLHDLPTTYAALHHRCSCCHYLFVFSVEECLRLRTAPRRSKVLYYLFSTIYLMLLTTDIVEFVLLIRLDADTMYIGPL